LGVFPQTITNLACFQLFPGQPGAENTLSYFEAHQDMHASKKSSVDFRADPVWLAAKTTSEEKAGSSLTREGGAVSVFLRPTDLSPWK
jgi:hypothetical protein